MLAKYLLSPLKTSFHRYIFYTWNQLSLLFVTTNECHPENHILFFIIFYELSSCRLLSFVRKFISWTTQHAFIRLTVTCFLSDVFVGQGNNLIVCWRCESLFHNFSHCAVMYTTPFHHYFLVCMDIYIAKMLKIPRSISGMQHHVIRQKFSS